MNHYHEILNSPTYLHIQKLMNSPSYQHMLKLMQSPAYQRILKDTETFAKIRNQYEAAAPAIANYQQIAPVMATFLTTFEKLPPDDQQKILNIASYAKIEPDHIPDKPSATVLPEENDPAWLQIRKALYPKLKEHGGVLEGYLLGSTAVLAKLDLDDLIPLYFLLASICFLVAFQGDPNKNTQTDKEE